MDCQYLLLPDSYQYMWQSVVNRSFFLNSSWCAVVTMRIWWLKWDKQWFSIQLGHNNFNAHGLSSERFPDSCRQKDHKASHLRYVFVAHWKWNWSYKICCVSFASNCGKHRSEMNNLWKPRSPAAFGGGWGLLACAFWISSIYIWLSRLGHLVSIPSSYHCFDFAPFSRAYQCRP